jgi:hypothetical protein
MKRIVKEKNTCKDEPKKYTIEEIQEAFCKFEKINRRRLRLEETGAIEDFIYYLLDPTA